MKTYIVLFLLLATAVSCNQKAGTGDKIFIDLSGNVTRSEDLSPEIDRIEFFQIDNSMPIDKISSLRMLDDQIIFLHKGGNYSSDVYGIVSVNNYGKVQWNFDKKGKGPGEFSNVFFMSQLPYRKQVAFYDYDSKKINFLNSDGEYLRSFIVDEKFNLISELPNRQLVASYNKNSNRRTDDVILKHDIVFLDENGGISKKFLPNSHNAMTWFTFGETLLPGDNQNIYTNTLQYTIFTISPEGVDSTWSLDFGKYNADTTRYLHPKGPEDFLMSVDSDEVISFRVVHSQKHIWVLVPHTNQSIHLAVINKKNHSVSYYKKAENRDFYYQGIPIPMFSLTQNQDCFVYSLSAMDALEKWEQLTPEEQSSSDPKWKELMENLDPESNPIICKLYAK